MALSLYVFWVCTWMIWTWLALAPLPSSSPEWLAQTRLVCFGSAPDGLPDGGGWVNLAAPLPMLLALVVLQFHELKASFRGLKPTLAAVLLLLPVGTFLAIGERVYQARQTPSVVDSGPLPPDYPEVCQNVPDFQLKDQHGQSFGPAQLGGQATLLTFAYAHCQTVCPLLLDNLREVCKRRPCRPVIVTLDPWRDTCGSLEGMARFWQLPEQAALLSGPLPAVEQTLQAFEVPRERNASTGEIIHPALVLVLDSQARIRYRFANPTQAWLTEAIDRVAH